MLDGVVPGEVLAVIGVESRMVLHRHLVVGDVGVLDGEETGTGTGIVTMISGGYRRPEGIVTLRLSDVVGVEEAEDGQETRDLVVHPAETPGTIERTVDPDNHEGEGYYVEHSHKVDYTTILICKYSSASVPTTATEWEPLSTSAIPSRIKSEGNKRAKR